MSLHPNEAWSAGDYQLKLQFGATTYQIAMHISDDFPQPGSSVHIDSAPKLDIQLAPGAACVYAPTPTAQTVSMACTTSNEKFVMTTSVFGMPQSVSARLERADALLLDRTVTPGYGADPDNLPGCKPPCLRAYVEFIF